MFWERVSEANGLFTDSSKPSWLTDRGKIHILYGPPTDIQEDIHLRTEGVALVFEDDAVEEIARIAEDVNNNTENIGARRLHTLMEFLLEDVLFEAPDQTESKVVVDKDYVLNRLQDIKDDEDLSRFIL